LNTGAPRRVRNRPTGRRHVAGGTIVTDLTDRNSVLEVSGNGGTLDGTAGRSRSSPGRRGGWRHADDDREGAIANSGTLEVAGNLTAAWRPEARGTVTLTGRWSGVDDRRSGNASAEQAITGTVAADTPRQHRQPDQRLRRARRAGTLTLQNQTKGTVEAIGGILTSIPARTRVNQ